jgi:hypothetical protein
VPDGADEDHLGTRALHIVGEARLEATHTMDIGLKISGRVGNAGKIRTIHVEIRRPVPADHRKRLRRSGEFDVALLAQCTGIVRPQYAGEAEHREPRAPRHAPLTSAHALAL